MDDKSPAGGTQLYYCDTCTRLIRPGAEQGIKDGDKRLCGECAAKLPPARPSGRNLKPATPGSAIAKPARRDSRRLATEAPDQAKPIKPAHPISLLLAIGGGVVALLGSLVLWLVLRPGAPVDKPIQGPPDVRTAARSDPSPPALPPVSPPSTPSPPLSKTDPAVSPQENQNPPAQPVQVPMPVPVTAPKEIEKRSGPTPEEQLATFKKELESATAMIAKERYGAAGKLLSKLQESAAVMPWWKDQEARWKEPHEKLQRLIQEGREEAEAACVEAEKASDAATLEALERQWRPRRASARAGELTAEWAKKVLDAVSTARRGQRSRLCEKLAAQLEEKLPALEKSMAASHPSAANQRSVAELEAAVIQNLTLIDRYGERIAALRWMLDTAQEEDLAPYHANLRKVGGACEVGFDFSSREQFEVWELNDPEKLGRAELLKPGPGLLLETKGNREWAGKNRSNAPILRLPLLIRPERWAAEVDVELVSKPGDRPYQACLTVWDGGTNHVTLAVEDSGAKGWTPILFGCMPRNERIQAKVAPLPARTGDSVRLQMAGMGETLTCAVRSRGGVVALPVKDHLDFQPKYLGLMVHKPTDTTAVAHFRDLKFVGVPDAEKLKTILENRKPVEVKKLVDELRLRGGAAERIAAGKSFPLPLGEAANVASGSRLKDGRSDDERLLLPCWGLLAVEGIPFQVADPQGATVKNAILLKGDGAVPSKMPESVKVPCGRPAGAIHLLSGVSVGGFPGGEKGSATLTLRIVYADEKAEEYAFKNGLHFADYARQVDVPDSHAALKYQGHQVRCISVKPKRPEVAIKELEFMKGGDGCAPLILGVTLEAPRSAATNDQPSQPLATIAFEAITGAGRCDNFSGKGKNGWAIWAQSAPIHGMSANFSVAEAPAGESVLELLVFRQSRAEGCLIDIFINQTRIFSGRDPSPNRNEWNTTSLVVPPGALKDGANTLRIDCTEPNGRRRGEPWFMLNSATLRAQALQDPGAAGDAGDPFRYYKFTPTKFKGQGTDAVQLSELQFFANNTWTPASSVTSPGGNNAGGQPPPNANDNNIGTKWFDQSKGPIVYDFGAEKSFNSYNWATAEDCNHRDPIRWKVEGSNDGATWTMLDDKTGADQPVTEARQTWVAPGASRFSGWKLPAGGAQ